MALARAPVLGALAAGLAAGAATLPNAALLGLLGMAAAVGFAATPTTGRRTAVAGASSIAALAGLAAGQARERALAPAPAPPYLSGLPATVIEPPRQERFGRRALIEAGKLRLLARGRGVGPNWSVGEIVRARGSVRPLAPDEGWLRARRVSGVIRLAGAPVVGRRGGLIGVVDTVRNRALAALGGPRGSPEATLLQGMVLGDDAAMAPAQREQMRRTGLGHLVAASGANVALLVALVFGACALAGVGWNARLAVATGTIVFYALLCGAGPSILRAAVMGIAALAAIFASRPSSRLHAILLAAVVTLAIDPGYWRDVGWQLSFAAVIGLALLGGRFQGRLARAGWPGVIAEPLAMTLAATVATAPIAAAAFGTVSPASLPANVLAAPLVAPATWLGMVGGALAQVDDRLSAPAVTLARLPAAAIVEIAARLSALPIAQVEVGRLPAPFTGGPAGPGAPPAGGTRITFLDVGQGDATLLQSRGESLLVDAGPPEGPVVERLREAGVKRLDALLVTHAQADHLGGADSVIEEVGADAVLDGRDEVREPHGARMAATARNRGVPIAVPRVGDRLRVGDLMATVLAPTGQPVPGGDPNLRCLVLRVEGPGLSLLLGADSESQVLAPLRVGPVRMLKVSHHGSADPGLRALLEELRPDLAVIEVGSSNRYGHPVAGTISALRRSGARVMRTDRDGSVRVDLIDGVMRVQRGS